MDGIKEGSAERRFTKTPRFSFGFVIGQQNRQLSASGRPSRPLLTYGLGRPIGRVMAHSQTARQPRFVPSWYFTPPRAGIAVGQRHARPQNRKPRSRSHGQHQPADHRRRGRLRLHLLREHESWSGCSPNYALGSGAVSERATRRAELSGRRRQAKTSIVPLGQGSFLAPMLRVHARGCF
jgi:hypothetical protein